MEGIWVNSDDAGGQPLPFASPTKQVSVSPWFTLLPLIQSRVILLKWFRTLIQGHKEQFHMSLIFTRLYIWLYWSWSTPFATHIATHTHQHVHEMIICNKSGLSMAQLWKLLSLIYYKDLKYNMVDYALISALTIFCWGKTPALYSNRISRLISVRLNTHRWSDRKN